MAVNRVPSEFVTFKLPYPPSVNRLWRISGKRMYRSKRYVEWLADCEYALERFQGFSKIGNQVAVTIIASRPDRRKRDLDNLAKPILDVCQEYFIVDDSQVARLEMYWTNEGQGVQVTIKGDFV